MKIRNIILAAFVVCMAAACSKDATNFKGTDKKSDSPMSVTEQKAEINSKVSQALANISAAKEGDLVEIGLLLTRTYGGYEMSKDYEEKLDGISKVEQEPKEATMALTKALGEIFSDPTTLPLDTWRKTTVTVAASLQSITGILTANDETHKWDYKAASDRLEFNFKDGKKNDCKLVITGNKKCSVVKVAAESVEWDIYSSDYNKYEDYYNYEIKVPTVISVVATKGNTEVGSITIKSGLDLEVAAQDYYTWISAESESTDTLLLSKLDYKKLSVDAVVAGKAHTVEATIKADGKQAEETLFVKAGEEVLLSEYLCADYNKSNIAKFLNITADYSIMYRLMESDILDGANAVVALGSDIFLTAAVNMTKYAEFDKKLDDAKSEEENKAALMTMNDVLNVYLYFAENKWQARLVFEFNDDDAFMPLIEFADGTKYEVSDVLNHSDFERVMYAAYGVYVEFEKTVQDAFNRLPGAEEIK